VRDAFLALEPNEADFLALYQVQSGFDAKWDGADPKTFTAAEQREFEEAKKQYEDEIREHLGPERFEKFLQTREPDFQDLQDTIVQFGLAPHTAEVVFGFKNALEDERKRLLANGALPTIQRSEILKALSEETERAMVEVLGPRPYRYYVRSGAGKWIWE
jgi:hypothetical protein